MSTIEEKVSQQQQAEELAKQSTYSMRYFDMSVPKFKLPKMSMPEKAAFQLLHDELNLDGNPLLNLASFVTTWMDDGANKLIAENFNKNFIDQDEYPSVRMIHQRCVNILADLFSATHTDNAVGTSTVGSSEAIMLALLAHKWNWKKRQMAHHRAVDKPNIVYGADVHTCWDKFARYFEVESRVIPLSPGNYTINPVDVLNRIDENTICVGAILGTTFTGQVDPIEKINQLLVDCKKDTGLDIPIHVDGASGGFVAPFAHPKLKWDFRLEQVKSINVSGHKYGLVYPGIGWLIFRDAGVLPKELIFNVNYLGGEMPTYTLNFSKNSAGIIAQYYNFIHLGREGYTRVIRNCFDVSSFLMKTLNDSPWFTVINREQLLPIVTFKLKKDQPFSVYDISQKLRERGWIVPAYSLPPDAESVSILRVVVKENFSHDLAEMFCQDIFNACDSLKTLQSKSIATNKEQRGVC